MEMDPADTSRTCRHVKNMKRASRRKLIEPSENMENLENSTSGEPRMEPSCRSVLAGRQQVRMFQDQWRFSNVLRP